MTQGVFEVSGIHHSTIENDQLLEYATLAESYSTHPISKSLQKAYGKPVDKTRIKDVKEISGHGVIAKIDNITVMAGNDKLMKNSIYLMLIVIVLVQLFILQLIINMLDIY